MDHPLCHHVLKLQTFKNGPVFLPTLQGLMLTLLMYFIKPNTLAVCTHMAVWNAFTHIGYY